GQHASIHIVAIPAATVQVGPGGSFTDTFVISDPNNEGAHDVSLLTTYPAAVQLHGVQFSRGGAWVDSTTGNSFVARLGDIGRAGDAAAVTLTMEARPFGGAVALRTSGLERGHEGSIYHNRVLGLTEPASEPLLEAIGAWYGRAGKQWQLDSVRPRS